MADNLAELMAEKTAVYLGWKLAALKVDWKVEMKVSWLVGESVDL